MDKLSFAFVPMQTGPDIVLRPMLLVTIKYGDIEFPTALLLDSGADYSMLRTDVVEDYLLINISDLKKDNFDTSGIGGDTKVGLINLKIKFGQKGLECEETLPFQVPINPERNPPLSLIGRIPFFYNYRIDFRMGYTDDLSLGKFVIYPENHKREGL